MRFIFFTYLLLHISRQHHPHPMPTVQPTVKPSNLPTNNPTPIPSSTPTILPTLVPTITPTILPTIFTYIIYLTPSYKPTYSPTYYPIINTYMPTISENTTKPTNIYTFYPNNITSIMPSRTKYSNHINYKYNYLFIYILIYFLSTITFISIYKCVNYQHKKYLDNKIIIHNINNNSIKTPKFKLGERVMVLRKDINIKKMFNNI